MADIDRLSLERRIDALFERYTRPDSPGAVIGIMRDGAVLLCRGYGLAQVERNPSGSFTGLTVSTGCTKRMAFARSAD